MVSLKKLPLLSLLLFFLSLLPPSQTPAFSAGRELSVRIADNLQSTVISSGAAMLITDGTGKEIRLSGANTFSRSGSDAVAAGKVLLRLPVRIASDRPLSCDGKAYRGFFVIRKGQNGFKISNLIPLEQYLRGVISSEMGTKGPVEALKAQCVLARTYAVAAKGKHGDDDLCASYHCQIYRGIAGEDSIADRVLGETAGLILRWNGAPANVYYHSDSGGMVTSSADVWGRVTPYLKARPEPIVYKGPNTIWELSLPMSSIEAALSAAGIYRGEIRSLRPVKRDASGRVMKLEIEGGAGKKEISGYSFRNAIGPGKIKSTLFEFGVRSPYLAESRMAGGGTSFAAAQSALPKEGLSAAVEIDLADMPDDKEEKVVWFTKKGIFTTLELMEILSKRDEIDRYIETGIARAEGRLPLPQAASPDSPAYVSGEPEPTELSYTVNLSMAPAAGPAVKICGRGAGHGVGLSQRGAIAMAEKGWSFEKILLYYFPGTTVGE